MLAVLAAVAMALPVSGGSFPDSVQSDIPREIYDTNLAAMAYEALVNPQGKIESCKVRVALSDAEAGEKVCNLIVGRQVAAARGLDGKPAFGIFRGAITLTEDRFQKPVEFVEPDFTILVAKMPSGSHDLVRIDLVGMVDESGRLTDCAPKGKSSDLSKVACETISGMEMPVMTDRKGQAVPYVYPVVVAFKRDKRQG